MKTFLKLAVAVFVLGGAGLGGWWFLASPEAATVPPTVEVRRGSIEKTVLASGVLEANALTSVGAEVSGRIDSINVVLGQEIKQGDLIAQIDSLDQENAVKKAGAVLKGIEAQKRAQVATLATAEAALSRSTQMFERSLISQTDFDSAKAAVDAAAAQIDGLDAQIAEAQLAVESAELNLSRTKIVAPTSGTVVALLVSAGQTVNASSAIPTIVKIADLDTMVIKAEISEADVVRVLPGQRVYFTILGEPDRRIDATLREVEPAPTSIATEGANDSAVYYNGLFDVPNPDHRLRISMTAQVTIVLDEAADTLVLSSGLLTRRDADGNATVMVYDPATQTSQPRKVQVGLDNNVTAQVLGGLEEGEQVVQSGATRPSGGGAGAGGMRMGGAPMMRL